MYFFVLLVLTGVSRFSQIQCIDDPLPPRGYAVLKIILKLIAIDVLKKVELCSKYHSDSDSHYDIECASWTCFDCAGISTNKSQWKDSPGRGENVKNLHNLMSAQMCHIKLFIATLNVTLN